MKATKPLIIIGSIIVILGGIFHLQGQSVVGPESSFMYSNPEWITHGLEIVVLGTIMAGIGIGLRIYKKI